MGVGKSTVARALAEKLGVRCAEMDEMIASQQQMAITEIFDKYGESYFRDLETEWLCSCVAEEHLVVSCGGGSVLREENAALMKANGRIVLLTARPETIYRRVGYSRNRPMLNGHMDVEYIKGLMDKRSACYEAVADISVETDDKSAEEICEEILVHMGQ